jgi:hypothetical protein
MRESLRREANIILKKIEQQWETEANKIRTNRFKDLNSQSWKTTAEGSERREAMETKYAGKSLTDLHSQRALYWLSTDQINPPPLKFR